MFSAVFWSSMPYFTARHISPLMMVSGIIWEALDKGTTVPITWQQYKTGPTAIRAVRPVSQQCATGDYGTWRKKEVCCSRPNVQNHHAAEKPNCVTTIIMNYVDGCICAARTVTTWAPTPVNRVVAGGTLAPPATSGQSVLSLNISAAASLLVMCYAVSVLTYHRDLCVRGTGDPLQPSTWR